MMIPRWLQLRAFRMAGSLLLLTLLCALIHCIPTYAQSTGTLAGTVTDAASHEPLEGVNVLVEGTSLGAATDAEGSFRLPNVPAGAQTLVARTVGYRTATETVTVQAGATTRVAFTLQAQPIGLQGVEVRALRPDLQPTGELAERRIQSLNVADSGTLLRSLPGIDAIRRGALGLDPSVRGLTETEVGVYVDGMRSLPAGPLRMDSQLSHFDPESIIDIEVVKGPYALTWGPGNLSAIRVRTRGVEPPPGLVNGSLKSGYTTNETAWETVLQAEGSSGVVYYGLTGAYREGSDYDSGRGASIPADYASGDARGRIGWRVSPQSTVEATGGYQNQQDIDYPGRLLDADFFRSGSGALSYAYAAERGLLRGLDARAYAMQTLHRMTNEGKPTFEAGMFPNGNPRPPLRISVDAEIQTYGGRLAATLTPASAWTLEVGSDLTHTYRTAERPLFAINMEGNEVIPPFYRTEDGTVRDEVWPGVTVTQWGGFANTQYQWGRVRLSGTARLDQAWSGADRPTTDYLANADATDADLERAETMVSGALTASLPLTEQWSLSAGAGSAVRPPDALELYSDRFPASKAQTSAEFQGNPFLDPERSTQADVWVDGQGRRWTLRLSGFARRIDDYITITPSDITPLLPLSPETVFRYVNGEATFYGGELTAAYAVLDPLTVNVSASYLWGKDETLSEPTIGIAPPQASIGARWAIPIASTVLSDVFMQGRMQVAAEQTREAALRGEQETEGYTVIDVRAGATVSRVSLQAGVQNLFDEAYVNHLNANNPFFGMNGLPQRIPEPGRTLFINATLAF